MPPMSSDAIVSPPAPAFRIVLSATGQFLYQTKTPPPSTLAGRPAAAIAMVNATPSPVLGGKVAGLVYFVPNPVPGIQGYAVTKGVIACATATSAAPWNAMPRPASAGKVAGLGYFV